VSTDGVRYVTSSFCGGGSCVEVALLADGVALRDTKDRGKPAHVFTATEWRDFVAGVKNGEFDLSY
jgi:hypothetical protein